MLTTAGRVRMPANNRVHGSAVLQTHGIRIRRLPPAEPDESMGVLATLLFSASGGLKLRRDIRVSFWEEKHRGRRGDGGRGLLAALV
ncbi:CAX-interacting protein 4-like isoform 2 [Corchorus olitorius]|uniref:CAX-interacting protein 4-like isoform 2 n=1 Tax=Corchorus olitorius TaxID=93759 RepID=A0A1R3KUV7_9ROSI|nr:CAX-interacting protein 4-like isoform 2 [Corchorus olitorius]